jgi:hypothetical protein
MTRAQRWAIARDRSGALALLAVVGLLLLLVALLALREGDEEPALALGGFAVALIGGAVALGGLMVRARQLVIERAEALRAAAAPGSPVAWVDAAVWAEVNEELFYRRAEAELLDRAPPVEGPAVVRTSVVAVADWRGATDEAQRRLDATPGYFLLRDGQWPLCCGELATLVARRLRDAEGCDLLPHSAKADSRGAHLMGFVCRRCGHRYAAYADFG